MAASPLADCDGPLTLQIKSGGSQIPDSAAVLSVATRAEMNRIPEAVIVIEDGDPASQEFPLSDGTLFVPGTEIEIGASYGERDPATIFEGVVVAMRLKIDGDRPSRLIVTCRDKAFKLMLARKSKLFAAQTDSAVIESLASGAGLTSDVTATNAERTGLVQGHCSDWDFLLSRAEVNGLLVWADAGKLTVKEPPFSATAALTVTYGLDLIRSDCEVDARTQLSSVLARSWSIADLAAISGEASPGTANKWGNLTGSTLAEVGSATGGVESSIALTDSDLTGIAKARQARAELARLRGQVRFQGNAAAKLGGTLEIAGLGERFNGTGLICGVVHRIEDGDWTTDASLGMDPDWRTDSRGPELSGAAGLAVATRGLQVGKVVKLTGDPDAQSLIQIELPLLAGTEPVWARLGGPYCSNGAGVMFLPEVGDEVVVGFLSDDPSYAVVLGSLHSSTRSLPLEATDENQVKTIVTPEKLRLEFDDATKKVTVATPGGNTVTLDDDGKSVALADQNGNTVTLDSAGITLDSAGDITIKAAKGVAIEATGDATVDGMNVTATGQTNFSASGNASAELKASGTVKVQGALVQIN